MAAFSVAARDATGSQKAPKIEVLRRMSFFLDLKDYPNTATLTNDIQRLGGTIEMFLSRDVKYVVTNRSKRDEKANLNSSSSLGSRSFSPAAFSLQGSSSNQESTKLRGNSALNSRAGLLVSRARQTNAMANGSRDVLQLAREWGSKIVHVSVLDDWIKKLKAKHLASRVETKENNVVNENQRYKLVTPFLKYEDDGQLYAPQYRQLDSWPVFRLNSDTSSAGCGTKIPPTFTGKIIPRKDSFREIQQSNKCKSDSMKKSVVTAGHKPGFCEMCSVAYINIYEHVDTAQHREFVANESNFERLDKAILALPKLEDYRRKLISNLTTPPNKAKRSAIQQRSSSEKLTRIKRKLGLQDFNFVQPPPNKKMSVAENGDSIVAEKQSPCSNSGRLPFRDVSNSTMSPSTRKDTSEKLMTTTENTSPSTRLLRSTAKRRTMSSSQSSPTCYVTNRLSLSVPPHTFHVPSLSKNCFTSCGAHRDEATNDLSAAGDMLGTSDVVITGQPSISPTTTEVNNSLAITFTEDEVSNSSEVITSTEENDSFFSQLSDIDHDRSPKRFVLKRMFNNRGNAGEWKCEFVGPEFLRV